MGSMGLKSEKAFAKCLSVSISHYGLLHFYIFNSNATGMQKLELQVLTDNILAPV